MDRRNKENSRKTSAKKNRVSTTVKSVMNTRYGMREHNGLTQKSSHNEIRYDC